MTSVHARKDWWNVDGSARISKPRQDQAQVDHADTILATPDACPAETLCAEIVSHSNIDIVFAPNGTADYFAAQQGNMVSVCRVEPRSSWELSFILEGLKANGRCPFSVRSGGHATWAGASNTEGGLAIDLRRMNKIEIAEDRKTVRVGAGANWKEVYDAVEPEGLMVIGGRMSTIGVGGFVLGGGISWITHRHGVAIDSVVSFELIPPNGILSPSSKESTGYAINVGETTEPALFRAMRGAGLTNFGIVASYELELTPHPSSSGKFWNQVTVHSWDQAVATTDLQNTHLVEGDEKDLDATQMTLYSWNPQAGIPIAIVYQVHNTHPDPSTRPEVFEPTAQLPPLIPSEAGLYTYVELMEQAVERAPPSGKRAHFSSTCFRPSSEAMPDIVALMHDYIMETKEVAGAAPAANIQPLYRSFFGHMQKRGGNSLGLDEETGPLHMLSPGVIWESAEDDESMYSATRKLIGAVEAVAKKHGIYHPYKYINYAAQWQEEAVWAGFGENNLDSLRQLQRQYDPERVFTRGGLFSEYFKLNLKN